MLAPETTSIDQSRWDVFINAGLKVLDFSVWKIRRLEVAYVELEIVKHYFKARMGQLTMGFNKINAKGTT